MLRVNTFFIVLKLVSCWSNDEGGHVPFVVSVASSLYISLRQAIFLCYRCEGCDFKRLNSYKLRTYVVLSSQSSELSLDVIGLLLLIRMACFKDLDFE